MPDNIETDILTSIGPVDNIHAEWEELTLRSPGNTFSNGPEYGKLTHQIAHRNGDQSRIITARIEGQLVGIWPIILHNEATLKVLRPPSCGSHEEYGHPLVDCRFEGEVLRALLNEAINIPCDRLMIMNARLGSVWSEVLAELPAEFRPELPSSLPGYRSQLSRFGSWQDYVASGAKSHLAGLASSQSW